MKRQVYYGHLLLQTLLTKATVQAVRDHLIETIRTDHNSLTARLEDTSFETNLTRWSITDYRVMILRVQRLQQVRKLAFECYPQVDNHLQALITCSSALELIEVLDPKAVNIKKFLLAKREAAETFQQFRKGMFAPFSHDQTGLS